MIITRHTHSGELHPGGAAVQQPRAGSLGKTSRVVSVAAGAALLIHGLLQLEDKPIRSLLRLFTGGYLLQRGLSGHCALTERLDGAVDKAEAMASNTYA